MITEDTQVQACLEQICQQGCRQVNRIIQQLKQGTRLPETQHLTPFQNTLLLQELQNIMAVYTETGNCRLN
ncbi:hypothetical protein THII_1766 [Thioploca ingrica]|uniref:Uncharacterized protein n=1 Tax=Thioploca ingrica TaxID=40754 RepID=A0A090ADS7_9GAMM|nr:hypothetical protein THII_1766 [Thioploca ingrica]